MKWESKIEMVKLLNSGKYEEAVDLFGKEEDWDDQAVDMFVTGFNLVEWELLRPIKERITSVKCNDFRVAARLAYIDTMLNTKPKE